MTSSEHRAAFLRASLGLLLAAVASPAARAEDAAPRSPDEVRRVVEDAPASAPVRAPSGVTASPATPPLPPAHARGHASSPTVGYPVRRNPCCPPGLTWHVTLGAWFPAVKGYFGDGFDEVYLDKGLDEVFSEIGDGEVAPNLRVRAQWRRWSATVEYAGLTVEDSATFEQGGEPVDGEMSAHFVQAQVGLNLLGAWSLDPVGECGCPPCAPVTCFEAYVGARAWWTDLDFESNSSTAGPRGVDASKEWVDPIVGIRFDTRVLSRWSLLLEADVGGFDLASELTWHILGAVTYHVSDHVGIRLGWKALDVRYKEGDFLFDTLFNGPTLGVTFTF